MFDIISFDKDTHRETELLLPWHATGQLDPHEAAKVEAHLAECTECRSSLDQEIRLKQNISDLPLHLGPISSKSLTQLRAGMADRPSVVRRWSKVALAPASLVALMIAQAAMLAFAVLIFRPLPAPEADYRTLGSDFLHSEGNMVVIFRPDITERKLRLTLDDIGARLVNGPTDAGAYVLRVAPAQRSAALTNLRARPYILLAQPIEPTGTP